jgi:2-iminobutanoate/2-iminopropanoate deaminase
MSALAHSGLDPATGEVVKARRSNDKPSLLWNSSSCASRRRVYRWIKCSSATSIARPLICSPLSTLSTPYFPKNPPAGIFVNVPAWHFDIEVDCIAAVVDKD